MNLVEFKEHNVIQGSPEWFKMRVGLITSSTLPKMMPSDNPRGGPWNKTQLGVLRKVAAEVLTGRDTPDSYKSSDMLWGSEWEEEARINLGDYLLRDARSCGFFTRSDMPLFGDSPDCIIGDMEAVGELKCPASSTHVKYLQDPMELWKEYRWQVIGHMYATGINTAYLASYDPRMSRDKRLVVCAPPDGYESDLIKLEIRLREASAMIEELAS